MRNSSDDPKLFNPYCWPPFWRRAFVLTFPISAPIYVLLCGLAIAAAVMIYLPVMFFGRLWHGDREWEPGKR